MRRWRATTRRSPLKPDYAEAFNNRGHMLKERGAAARRWRASSRHWRSSPTMREAQFAVCMAQLPILYEDEPEIAARRAAYDGVSRALCDEGDRGKNLANGRKRAASTQPFYPRLSGLQRSRSPEPLRLSRVPDHGRALPAGSAGPATRPDEPVRVGIVSGFFRQHSNWKIPIKGWLSQIDRRRFRIFGYHTGVKEDDETKEAAACAIASSRARCRSIAGATRSWPTPPMF